MLSVGQQPSDLSRTLLVGNVHDSEVDLVAAQLPDPSVVRDGAADIVTCMQPQQEQQRQQPAAGGLHPQDAQRALLEAHRILRPGGKLVVAFNDRDLGSLFVDMAVEVLQAAVPGYSRAAAQHAPAAWLPLLRQGGLFRPLAYSVHAALLPLPGAAAAADLLVGQGCVQEALTGEQHRVHLHGQVLLPAKGGMHMIRHVI